MLLAGTAVGFLTGLFGVGGGFVIVPALTLVLGLSMPEAIGTSLLVIAINSAVALATRLGSSTIDWSVAMPFTVAAILGVLVGKRIADRLDARTQPQLVRRAARRRRRLHRHPGRLEAARLTSANWECPVSSYGSSRP